MASGLFEMFLSSFIGWGVGRALDVLTGCPTCGQKDRARIGNAQHNHLECRNCHHSLKQFTNGCDLTYNKSNSQIGHGVVWPRDSEWEWEKKGFWDELTGMGLQSRDTVKFLYGFRLQGLKGRSLVHKSVLRCYDENHELATISSIIKPSHYDAWWNEYWARFNKSSFVNHGKIIACDNYLLSEYGDVIAESRILAKPFI